ncbi:MAG: hypothetical protein IT198_05730 [Acidimicrobiia bacterium]|nr:hypothetical protein [Acidimicrobiia bacterium]
MTGGLHITRRFTEGVPTTASGAADVYGEVEWTTRATRIANPDGEVIFEGTGEIPAGWSQVAADIMVSKYFRRAGLPDGGGETSATQVFDRLVHCWRHWGESHGYFDSDDSAQAFEDELRHMLAHQIAAPNSPQWFNTGLAHEYGITGPAQGHWYVDPHSAELTEATDAYSRPQPHACFILAVKDDLVNPGGIMDLWTREARIFKYGSGAGSNFSAIRGEGERLSGGGQSSGLMSFLKIGDRAAGAIKSGGTTRRAAKMVIIDLDHPDIEKFVSWKADEEGKVAALVAAGYSSDFEGEAYATVSGQNSNNSVRIPDRFFEALDGDSDWELIGRVDGRVVQSVRAVDLWARINKAAWASADPGVQYDTTINSWHTCPEDGRINASNPCFTGDTHVFTNKGQIRFRDLIDRVNQGEEFKVWTHDVTSPDMARQAVALTDPEAFMVTGWNRIVRLDFTNGAILRCTPGHKIWTANRGYVAAEDLTSEDDVQLLDIAAPAVDASWEIPVSETFEGLREKGERHAELNLPTVWSEDFAHYLGWVVGDGSATSRSVVATTYGSLEDQAQILPLHEMILSEIQGHAPKASRQANGTVQLRMTRGVFRRFLERLGLDHSKGPEKRVPWSIEQAPPQIQGAFLRGLFDADGCMRRDLEKGSYVGLGSTSAELLRGVQRILSSLGISGRIYETSRRPGAFTHTRKSGEIVTYESHRTTYDLRITSRSLVDFAQHVGFSLTRKNTDLRDVVGSFRRGPYTKAVVTRLQSRCADGIELTYNLSEPRNHSYIANGVVVRNCSEYMFLDDTACLATGTRISTPHGLRTVEDLYESQENGEAVVITTDIHSEHDHRRLTAHRPALVTRVGDRPVLRMKLKDGREIRATADHRFLSDSGDWKRVDELVVGKDRVEVRESGNPVNFCSPHDDVRRWRMLGWLTGDGVFSKGHTALVFGPDEADTAAWMRPEFNLLQEDASDFVGAERDPRFCNVSTQANGVLQLTSKSQALVRLLEDAYGFSQGTAIEKDVPSTVHAVPDDLKVAYLQGLFSADGSVRHVHNEPEVMLASSAPDLLRSVQLMLSDLGIESRITWTHPAGRKNPQGQLHIYNQQARKFLALVGFACSTRKQALADAVLGRPFAGALKNPRPSTVVEIVPDGVDTVYDITEPVTHSVIAEGMVTHNCNLASINLVKFLEDDGTFDIEGYRHAIRLWTVVLEISVLMAAYPSAEIAQRSYDYRTLGLGYANLGSLLMRKGIAYDSDEGRAICGALTAIMTGDGYAMSAAIAAELGPFSRYEANRDSMLRVIRNHRRAAYASADEEYEGLSVLPVGIDQELCPAPLLEAAHDAWDKALDLGERFGYRNAQLSVLAPTGTIGLLMDCDTTGVEPDFALVKFKKLAGGGYFKIANAAIEPALEHLGYAQSDVRAIMRYILGTARLDHEVVNRAKLQAKGLTAEECDAIEAALPGAFDLRGALAPWAIGAEAVARLGFDADDATLDLPVALGFGEADIEAASKHCCGHQTVEGAPGLDPAHYPIFDCANTCGDGERYLPVEAHIEMMAAAQPFISGSISKTANLPNDAGVEDISRTYRLGWERGLKAIALYRDGCKLSQPLSSGTSSSAGSDDAGTDPETAEEQAQLTHAIHHEVGKTLGWNPFRRKLPAKRYGWTHEAVVGGQKVFLRTGEYEDGSLGELFIDMAKEGATLRSIVNCFAIAVSKGLQYGVPLEEFVDTFTFTRFEPQGVVQGHPHVKMATSVIDYVFRALGVEYLGREDLAHVKPSELAPESEQLTLPAAEARAGVISESRVTETQTEEIMVEVVDAGPNGELRVTHETTASSTSEVAATATSADAMSAHLSTLMGDAPFCSTCGHITVRNGSCYRCLNCGNSMGCS